MSGAREEAAKEFVVRLLRRQVVAGAEAVPSAFNSSVRVLPDAP
ncbi:MAG TPA: hypothetical protein VMV10_20005 [Pirellulales bacterium]|nr:hypothetical protein [Pirellulales bacterium]